MKALILDGSSKTDHEGKAILAVLCEALHEKGWIPEIMSLEGMKIRPCVGCFSCWLKTPGKCAVEDDGRQVVAGIARCDALFFLCQVTFGGYASRLKHAVDRIIPTISPMFQRVGGEMHHRLRYPPHSFFAVGWQREADADSALVFAKLAARNAINMHAPTSGTTVLHGGQSEVEQHTAVSQLLTRLEVRK